MLRRNVFGVDKAEVAEFVAANDCVRAWLGRFDGRRSRGGYAHVLCRFFKWLRIVKMREISPKDLLNEQLQLSTSLDIGDRQRHLRLVLEHTRDNKDFAGLGVRRKHHLFIAIKSFYDFHEVTLTNAKGVFGRHKRKKHNPAQMSLKTAKKVLGVMGQRDRAILLCMLQSGMSIGDVLHKFNLQYDRVRAEIQQGVERIKICIDERKGNGFNYFTFISRDAIQELKKWFAVRDNIVKRHGDCELIFVTREGHPLSDNTFEQNYLYHLQKHKLKNGAYSVTSHMFRKLFKTESRPPERGIDQDCIEFMMGHISGIEAVGGTYDRTPELYGGVIEREYMKLEPFVNVYSGKVVEDQGLKKRIAELEEGYEKLLRIVLTRRE